MQDKMSELMDAVSTGIIICLEAASLTARVHNLIAGQRCFKEFQDKMSELMDVVSSRGPPSDIDTDLGTQLWRLVYEGECGDSVGRCVGGRRTRRECKECSEVLCTPHG